MCFTGLNPRHSKKISNVFDKSWEPAVSVTVSVSVTVTVPFSMSVSLSVSVEQLLFSCASSKVSICNYVTCHISHVTCHMSNAYIDPWDMLNKFCLQL